MLPKLFLSPISDPVTEPELTIFIKKEEVQTQKSIPSIVGMFALGHTLVFFILPENHCDKEMAKKDDKYDTENGFRNLQNCSVSREYHQRY